MASQIAHIVYAKKYIEKHPMTESESDYFYLGCVFPDIRRIDGTIKRVATHMRFSPVDLNFEGLTPFEAGWKFHLYCDMKREEFLKNKGFYAKKINSEIDSSPAKLLEDILVYESFNNWEKLSNYFNNPPILPIDLLVGRESYNLWYAILAKYIAAKPNEKSTRIFVSKMPSLAPLIEEIMKNIKIIKEDNKSVATLREIKDIIIN